MIIHEIPIAEISVGERRRQELGDIKGLAESIALHGLLHPITVNQQRELVCGERRLCAFTVLGRPTIPAQIFEELTGDRLREVELEENLRRKDITAYERSRTLTELAPVAAAVISSETEEMDARGRKSTYGVPKEAVAERLGVSTGGLVHAEQHVATAAAFPMFQQAAWTQSGVLMARKALLALPEEDRGRAIAFVNTPGTPPDDALQMLEHLAAMQETERRKCFTLAESPDVRDQDLAVTTAAQKVPCPDPRAVWLGLQITEVRRWLRAFPEDPLNDHFHTLSEQMHALRVEVIRLHQERIHGSN